MDGELNSEAKGGESSGSSKSSSQMSSSTRLQRNQAEKQRRDRLNGYISELATLVPMVHNASKPLDKVSILRLAAAQMRLNFSCLNPKRFKAKTVTLPSSILAYLDMIEKTVGGFIIVTTFSGVIVFCSKCIEDYVGYQNIDVMGNSIYSYIHSGDVAYFEKKVNAVIGRQKRGSSKKSKVIKAHMQQRPLPRSNDVRFRKMIFKISVHINDPTGANGTEVPSVGKTKKTSRLKDFGASAVVLMFVEPVKLEPEIDISYIEAHQDAYFTMHGLQGEIIYADQRISAITGYMPHDVQGTSAYQYICSSDVPIALFAQKAMFTSSDGTGIITYRLRIRDMRYIYLQSSGQIAYKDSSNEISHFVCFNKLLSDEEGCQELKKFQQRFAPQIIAAKMMSSKQKMTNGHNGASFSNTSVENSLSHIENSLTPSPSYQSGQVSFSDRNEKKRCAEKCSPSGKMSFKNSEEFLSSTNLKPILNGNLKNISKQRVADVSPITFSDTPQIISNTSRATGNPKIAFSRNGKFNDNTAKLQTPVLKTDCEVVYDSVRQNNINPRLQDPFSDFTLCLPAEQKDMTIFNKSFSQNSPLNDKSFCKPMNVSVAYSVPAPVGHIQNDNVMNFDAPYEVFKNDVSLTEDLANPVDGHFGLNGGHTRKNSVLDFTNADFQYSAAQKTLDLHLEEYAVETLNPSSIMLPQQNGPIQLVNQTSAVSSNIQSVNLDTGQLHSNGTPELNDSFHFSTCYDLDTLSSFTEASTALSKEVHSSTSHCPSIDLYNGINGGVHCGNASSSVDITSYNNNVISHDHMNGHLYNPSVNSSFSNNMSCENLLGPQVCEASCVTVLQAGPTHLSLRNSVCATPFNVESVNHTKRKRDDDLEAFFPENNHLNHTSQSYMSHNMNGNANGFPGLVQSRSMHLEQAMRSSVEPSSESIDAPMNKELYYALDLFFENLPLSEKGDSCCNMSLDIPADGYSSHAAMPSGTK